MTRKGNLDMTMNTDTAFIALNGTDKSVILGYGDTVDEAIAYAAAALGGDDPTQDLVAEPCSMHLVDHIIRWGSPKSWGYNEHRGLHITNEEQAGYDLENAIQAYAKAKTDKERQDIFDAIQEHIAADEDLPEHADFESAAQDLLRDRGLL
jgi:hypothetical protein